MSTILRERPARALSAAANDLFTVVLDPYAAFGRARRPSWAAGLAMACMLAVVGAALSEPVLEHLMLSPQGLLAGTPGDAQASTIGVVRTILRLQVALVPLFPLLCALWYTAAMTLVVVLAKRSADVRALWSVACYGVMVGSGVAMVARGAIEHIRGAVAYQSFADLYGVIPSLASFAATTNPHALVALAELNPVALWAALVLFVGVVRVARLDRAAATAAVGFALIPVVCLNAMLAR